MTDGLYFDLIAGLGPVKNDGLRWYFLPELASIMLGPDVPSGVEPKTRPWDRLPYKPINVAGYDGEVVWPDPLQEVWHEELSDYLDEPIPATPFLEPEW